MPGVQHGHMIGCVCLSCPGSREPLCRVDDGTCTKCKNGCSRRIWHEHGYGILNESRNEWIGQTGKDVKSQTKCSRALAFIS